MTSSYSSAYLVLCLIICGFCVTTGCTSTNTSQISPSPTTNVTTTAIESPVITPPILTATPSLVIVNTPSTNVTTNTPSTNVVSTIATPVPQITIKANDDPWIDNFQYIKQPYGISDCIMKQAFPDIAKDPDYGLNSAHPKLVGISNEKWNSFYQDWVTGKNTGQSTFSVSKCQNYPYSEKTTWDFISVNARITSRNARTTNYSIIVSISANQKNVAQLITNETLDPSQSISIESWIPIKRTEIGNIDKASINFNKITNI
jgi:hypothetical protein